MRMQVRTWIKFRDIHGDGKLHEIERAGSPTITTAGYKTVDELQIELTARFPQNKPRLIENGIAFDSGSTGESRQEITLHL